MFYPAKFDKEGDGYNVTFRDIPGAITCGDD
ncbi:HicB family protein, partial [Testudinibacter sp. TR-2022]